jgi:alkylation response protein AidB-like acyl-CoA dehydrogenase
MDLDLPPEDRAFRDEVFATVRDGLPASIRSKVREHRRITREEQTLWHDLLAERGWLTGHWPVAFGGQGWSPLRSHLFEEATMAADAPLVLPFGPSMVAPVIMRFGTEAQRAHWLPRLRANRDWWCQGYSEPGAGSDLAGLSLRAERDGDDYVLTGQKTWTTFAHHADMMFCLARTSTGCRRQEGITFLLVDMRSPGLTVKPILLLNGEHDVNEVWFDRVRVPVANRIGGEGEGWTCAKYLLGYERTAIARVGLARRELAFLKAIAKAERRNGRPLAEDARFAARVALVEIELMALEITLLRVAAAGRSPGPEASVLKIKGSEIQQTLSELAMEAAGPQALQDVPEAMLDAKAGVGPSYAHTIARHYLVTRKATIYGGSNEIQRNIIAQTVLGL